ncbi:MAG: NHLP bacteriocin system secretion protein [Pseudomonadota bacterium]
MLNPRRTQRNRDQLDVQITLIPRAFQFLFVAVALLMGAAGYWSVFGVLPTKAAGEGLIVSAGYQLRVAQSEAEGRIQSIAVAIGDEVDADDAIAELDQSGLEIQISEAQAAVDDLTARYNAIRTQLTAQIADHETTNAQLEAIYETSLQEIEEGQSRLAAFLEGEESLQEQGLATRSTVISTLVSQQNMAVQLATLKTQHAERLRDLADLKTESALRIDAAEEQLDAGTRELERLEALRARDTLVRAPGPGRIEEIRVSIGQNVTQDTTIATIAQSGGGAEVIAFLEAAEARRVTVGMPVQVVPSSINKAQYGSMRGRVSTLSPEPVSIAYASALLRNAALAQQLTESGTSYLARIELFEDRTSASGYEWWSGQGPSFPIDEGSLAQVDVILEERAPITLVIPAFRALIGLG